MNKGRITRQQAQVDEEAKNELEAFNPFVPTRTLALDSDPTSSNYPQPPSPTNLSISSEEEETIRDSIAPIPNGTMAQQNIPNNQMVSLKDALKMVPEFDGKNIPLSQFLEGCNEAKEMIEPNAEANLVKLIRSRLIGEARQAILGQAFPTIDALKDYIKNIYAPAKTTNQLLGELGNEFQRDSESVIAYANRMRDLVNRILEARRIEIGAVDQAFRTATENNVIECFKRGLRPEIEQRLPEARDIAGIVGNAIQVERNLEAKLALRKPMNKGQEKRVHYVEASDNKNTNPGTPKKCDFCHKTNHTIDQCFALHRQLKNTQNVSESCQICNKKGHVAKDCYSLVTCQLCNKQGHPAKNCRSASKMSVCQLCNMPGHTANTHFPAKANLSGPTENKVPLVCQICAKTGHTAPNCFKNPKREQTDKPICEYCKVSGHTIENCFKLQRKNAESGNGKDLRLSSVQPEIQTATRSLNSLQIDNLLSELIPFAETQQA